MRSKPVLFPLLALLLLAGCDIGGSVSSSGYDWTQDFEVECNVYGTDVSVSGRDFPEGATVEVSALPELSDTINASGIYMMHASLAPLSAGPHTLTFETSHEGRSAKASCSIERPAFDVTFEVQRTRHEERTAGRATLKLTEGEGEPTQTEVDLRGDADGHYVLELQTPLPKSASMDGTPIEGIEGDRIELKLPAEAHVVRTLTVENADGKQGSLKIELLAYAPYGDDETKALRPGTAHAWAPARPASAEHDPVGILIDQDGEVVSYTTNFTHLGQVEQIARVTVTETVVDTCRFGSGERVAEMDRVRQNAVVELFDAKTGELLDTSKTFKTRAPRCPRSAEFTVETIDFGGSKSESVHDKVVFEDVKPKAMGWFDRKMGG